METWNREELYVEIWEQPLVKVAPKYGISAVALGKVCRKLQIPLPGHGYWVKKDFGKPVEQVPLPVANDLPIVHRQKYPTTGLISNSQVISSESEPIDPEYLRIIEIESRTFAVNPNGKRHKLVVATERIFKQARLDDKGILQLRYDQPCLETRVSKGTLDRALTFVNALVLSLEAEGFSVSVEQGKHGTGVPIPYGRKSFRNLS